MTVAPDPPLETPDLYGAFPKLSLPGQIDASAAYGQRCPTEAGEVLFRVGDPRGDFFVILVGNVAIVEDYEAKNAFIGVHGPGRFPGRAQPPHRANRVPYGGGTRARRSAGRSC